MRRKANAGSIFFFQFFGHDFQKLNYFSRLLFLSILRKLLRGTFKIGRNNIKIKEGSLLVVQLTMV